MKYISNRRTRQRGRPVNHLTSITISGPDILWFFNSDVIAISNAIGFKVDNSSPTFFQVVGGAVDTEHGNVNWQPGDPYTLTAASITITFANGGTLADASGNLPLPPPMAMITSVVVTGPTTATATFDTEIVVVNSANMQDSTTGATSTSVSKTGSFTMGIVFSGNINSGDDWHLNDAADIQFVNGASCPEQMGSFT